MIIITVASPRGETFGNGERSWVNRANKQQRIKFRPYLVRSILNLLEKEKMETKTQIAIKNSRTLFPNKVKSGQDGLGKTELVIKKSTNGKLGKKILKGKWSGMPIYTGTLEERATCRKTCEHWNNCYGKLL